MPRDGSGPAPRPPEPPPRKLSSSEIAALVGAAVLIVAPITAKQEGYVPKAAPDPVGIPTACMGERIDQSDLELGRIYSRDECMARLRRRLAAEYAPPVLNCLPELADRRRRNVFAALIDAAWNAGPGNVCRSPMAVQIRAGRWNAACDAFVGWHIKPKGVVLGGLVKRRRDVEAPLCRRPVELPSRAVSVVRAQLQLCLPLAPLGPPPPIRRERQPPLPNQSELT